MSNIFKIIGCVIFIGAPQICTAELNERLNWGVFSLYEHASDRIKINNVSTRYGIGAVGLEVYSDLIPDLLKPFFRYGLGYHPNYTLKSFGTEFSGPVDGNLTEYGFNLETSRYLVNGSSFSLKKYDRRIFSDSLTGKRGNVLFTTTTNAAMTGTEYKFTQELYSGGDNALGVFIGTNSWKLSASGTAYSSDLTVVKKVTGHNSDPFWGVNIETRIFEKPISFGFTHRTITADNKLETLELFSSITF